MNLIENPRLAYNTVGFYFGVTETKGKPEITQPVSVSVSEKKVLVVDDVANTGKSLRLMRKHLGEHNAIEVKISPVYCKPWSILIPDYYGKETNSWIAIPLKRKETVGKVIEKYKREEKPLRRLRAN